MIHMYWTHPSISQPPSSAKWRELYDDYRVFEDADVMALLDQHVPALTPLYKRLTLPAGRSDIARFVILLAHGGFYLDAHAGPTPPRFMAKTLSNLASRELIVFDLLRDRKFEGDCALITGAIVARKGSPLLLDVLHRITDNLIAHDATERSTDSFVPYNLYRLTATPLRKVVLDETRRPIGVKPGLKDRVLLLPLSLDYNHGFRLYQHYGYRKPGQHWSERQTKERLFAR